MKKEYVSPIFAEIKVTSADFILSSIDSEDKPDDFNKEDFAPEIQPGGGGIF